jgi:hypothetical protein
MYPEHHRVLEDEPCPVAEQLLGELYRCAPHGLHLLISAIDPTRKATLAMYCYRRAHLTNIGLAVAATCTEDDLTGVGGYAGAALFARSREAPQLSPERQVNSRYKVSLARGHYETFLFSKTWKRPRRRSAHRFSVRRGGVARQVIGKGRDGANALHARSRLP